MFHAFNGLGHNLHQRNTRTVVVDEGVFGSLNTPGGASNVGELASIFFHVGALNGHVDQSSIVHLDGHRPFKRDGFVVLADLVVLRQVRVEVVLPSKARDRSDLTTQGETQAHAVLHSLRVHHGQTPWKPQTQGRNAGVGIDVGVIHRCGVGGSREHFGLGGELHVDFKPQDGFEKLESLVQIHQLIFRHGYATSGVRSATR